MLIFCGTVARVEQTAKDIAKMCAEGMMTIHERSTLYNSGASPSKRAEFIANLSKNTPDALRLCISHGVGYHHGSMHILSIPTVSHAKNLLLTHCCASSTPASGGVQCAVCKSYLFVMQWCFIEVYSALVWSEHVMCGYVFARSGLVCRNDD